MNWDQVRQLDQLGPCVYDWLACAQPSQAGGSTMTAQRDELTGSKQILEARLGRKIKALAYPYGWPGTYTTLTKALAAQAGYRLAFSSRRASTGLPSLTDTKSAG